MPYEYRMKSASESIAASSGEVREKIDAAEELLSEADSISREAEELFKRAEELKQKAKSMWYQGHNEMMEQTGSLPGQEWILYLHARDMRSGEWGQTNYAKAIEIYKRFLYQKSEKYTDLSIFWLAAMHLKGKYDDTKNKDRVYRKNYLSNIAVADEYAKTLETTNPSLYKKYIDKKRKYLNIW
jgi:hypothetical protein